MALKTHEIWNRRFLSRIIESMADGVFTMDSQGNISSWNQSMERISGYTANEALGRRCDLLNCSRCFGENCPANIEKCQILTQEHIEVKECQLRHKDGHDVPVIKNASVVKDEDGVILGVVETVTDVTELNQARQRAEQAALRLGDIHRLDNIIGKSQAMRDVFTAIKAAADSDATIIIQGESGTGKELVAGAIHFNSMRRDKPLITVNCSALSESLLESELFGHARGAYTGAVRDRIGRFEETAGGTLFLDEIGELSSFIQVKLLRVLQEREIERVGESRKRKIDIRLITATHQDIYKLVSEGNFREDLYYRLKVFPITIPPLRQHKEDIPLLISHFVRIMNKKTGKQVMDTSREVMRTLMDHDWPGNVRELENAIEHAFVLCKTDRIELKDLPLEIRQRGKGHTATKSNITQSQPQQSQQQNLKQNNLTKENLLALLADCAWNKAEVARRVGVSRTAIWKYMKKWDIPLQGDE